MRLTSRLSLHPSPARLARALALALFAVLTTSSCAEATPAPPPPPPRPSVADEPLFYRDISAYGDWWWNDQYGWVFSPYVDTGWRPYTVGHWSYTTEYGWVWVSGEPFGWVCHHYGRWLWLDDAGWIWVPGSVWAPAWVAWRTGPGFIGWAPLGPDAVWIPGRGFLVADVGARIGPWAWVFVDERNFLVINVVTVVHTHAQSRTILPRTHVLHRPERGDHGRIVDPGVDPRDIERATGTRVTPRPVVDVVDGTPEARPRTRDDAVPIRRAPDVERRTGARDIVPDRRAPPPSKVEVRPLRTPADDVDGRFDAQRRRIIDRDAQQERAGRAPPAQLQQQRQRELEDLDKAKEKEKKAKEKKKSVPRKVLPKGKRALPAPRAP